MSEQAKHTPTPWSRGPVGGIYPHGGGPMIAHAETKSGKLPSWVENEAFIVRAVNAHDALVEALKWFVDRENWREEQLSEGFVYSAEWRVGFSPIEIARAALALAEAKP